MATLPFQQVDVFTALPFRVNPVAVILEGDGLSTAEMQQIAGWTNLSEGHLAPRIARRRSQYPTTHPPCRSSAERA